MHVYKNKPIHLFMSYCQSDSWRS